MSFLRPAHATSFRPPPPIDSRFLQWPTENRLLFSAPERYFAFTRANPNYGRPGWTRDCGKRFHRGCDIAPVRVEPDGKMHAVMFSNCQTGAEYASEEQGWIPHDSVYATTDGVVVEQNEQAESSTLGRYLIMRHTISGQMFFSLYAHLDKLFVALDQPVGAGERIATMGQTSSSADARIWMAIAPHLHLEFWNAQGQSFDPEAMLRALLKPES